MIRTVNKAALYARFSSDNQRTESIDAQMRAMKAYCKQHNFLIVKTYIDEAKSATTDRRPAFQEMVSDSSSGMFNILLVHKLDRFARNRYDSAVYKRELKKNGVIVYSVLENLDNSPESIMMESVLEGMSEYYSRNLSREVMKGMRETALQCKHTGGRPPLGYDVDPDTQKLVINESEAETVRLIFNMYADGYGYSDILNMLHQKGMLTKRNVEFKKNSMSSILRNPKYKGCYIFNRRAAKDADGRRNDHLYKSKEEIIYIDGGCPQIVDEETFNKVQRRISDNRHNGASHTAKERYLFTGRIYCKECGKAMSGSSRYCGRSKLKYVTYRCLTNKYGCSGKEINRNYLEEYVIDLIEKYILNPVAIDDISKRIEEYKNSPKKEEKLKKINQEIENIEKARSNIADAIADGLISEALISRLDELDNRKADLEEQALKLRDEGGSILIDPKVILSEYERVKSTPYSPVYRNFIRDLIERIEIGRFSVSIALMTGLGVAPELNNTFVVKRQEIYQRRKDG